MTTPTPFLSPICAAILFASSYVPSTEMYSAPYDSAWAIFAVSILLGAKIYHGIFAFAACAAVADARLPVDAQPTDSKPNSFALDIATPAGLSLNENVGFTESFFM